MNNQLIKITADAEGKQLVSARELHEFLGLTTRFSVWINQYIKEDNEFRLKKDIDFTEIETFVFVNNNAKRILNDYNLNIDTALIILRMSKSNPKAIELISVLMDLLGYSIEVKEQKRLEFIFGDMLDKITGFKWERQYCIDNKKYKLDFFLKDTLIVEYDEEHHKYQEKEDLERMNYCRKWLNENESEGDDWLYPVIRVKKGEELEGLNRIVRHLAGFEIFDTQYNYRCQVCDIGVD